MCAMAVSLYGMAAYNMQHYYNIVFAKNGAPYLASRIYIILYNNSLIFAVMYVNA